MYPIDFRYSLPQKIGAVFQAFYLLCFAFLIVRKKSDKEVFNILSDNKKPLELLPTSDPRLLALVTKAIGFTARKTPFNSNCLIRAVAAKFWLNKKRISSDINVSVRRNKSAKPYGHVWLTVDGLAITNPGNQDDFAPIYVNNSRSKVI
ncbi:MAG: lasso peptide biosynthesis B2 protein [Rhizobiaceae bacterium]